MKRLFSIAAALMLLIAAVMPAAALDFDPYRADVSWESEKAPEGTVWLDILIKLPESDEAYTDFGAPPRRIKRGYLDKSENTVYEYESLNVNADSEIACYDKDGYVSMTCHYRGLRMMTVNGSEKDGYYNNVKQELDLYSGYCTTEELYEKYGSFRAAYVDQNGQVLGVANVFEEMYKPDEPYALVAQGGRLVFRISGTGFGDVIEKMLRYGLIAVLITVIAAAAAAVILLIRRKPDEDKGE